MDGIFKELFELNKLDLELIALRRKLRAGPDEIALREKEFDVAREERRALEIIIKDKMSEADTCNLDARTAEEEVAELEEKLNATKNSKEYKILTNQIKKNKQIIDDKESAALNIMEELDTLRTELKEKQEEFAGKEAELEKLKAEIENETADIRTEGRAKKQKRTEVYESIKQRDTESAVEYESAYMRGKGAAFAEMTGDTCQECFRRLNPQVVNLVSLARSIKECRCPGCGRILYIKREVAAPE